MALTLDATLAAAQDNASRRPLVEIVSAQRTADIPFDGSMLTAETFDEYGVNLIPHSSGRLVIAYIYYSGTTSGIKFVYTDTGRTEFTTVDLPLYTYVTSEIKSVSICELTGGNIGMVLLVDDKTNHLYRLTRRIYTTAGVAVSDAEIANWSHDLYTADPWVQTIAENSYLIVYGKIETAASPDHYHLYKRTSSDFLTWAAEAELSIASIDDTYRKSNPSIIKISTGDLWLWFSALESTGPNGEELTNIYYSVSSDGGGTWGAAVKVTSYTGYAEVGGHPVAVQKAANQMNLIYTRKVGALHMDDTTTGWPTGDNPGNMHFDATNRKLYYTSIWAGAGTKGLFCVVQVDVDTWTVDRYWDDTTTPGFDSDIMGAAALLHVWPGKCTGDEDLIPVTAYAVIACSPGFIQLLNATANTITTYAFCDYSPSGISQNVTHSIPSGGTIIHVQVDKSAGRMYVLWAKLQTLETTLGCGYIDLSETGPAYAMTDVLPAYATGLDYNTGNTIEIADCHFRVYPEDDLIVFSSGSDANANYRGMTAIFTLSTGGLYKLYNTASFANYPRYGINSGIYYAGKFWGGFPYCSASGEDSKRGLCEIDIVSDNIVFYRPTTLTVDDYEFHGSNGICVGETNQLIIASRDYGIFKFDTVSHQWEQFSNANVSGLTPDGEDLAQVIAYDETGEFIFAAMGETYTETSWQGPVMFSVHGFIRQAYYSIGADPGSGWSFATPAALVQGYLDYDAAAAVEPGSSTAMYVFWNNETVTAEKSIKWDKDGSSFDLSPYIAGEVAFERSIGGRPASLSFSVSHGQLFDPYNLASLFSIYLKKGRELTLRFGETVSATAYWANQGSYFIVATSLSFERGSYPLMAVEAEDQRCLWAHSHIYVTDIYNNLPEDIIEDILEDEANMAAGDLNLPVFVGGTALEMQWIETTIDEILNQVCNRFGYFFRFDMDGSAHARQITNVGAIDHAYTGFAKLKRFTPDDRYSDFTNRVTVQGQELSFTQVTFEEERVGAINGTVGWWGFRHDYQIWFSEDRSRRCVHPRLGVRETATSIAFQLAGDITETLTEGTEPGLENHYCTITVTAPNLIPLLVSSIAMIASGLAIGDGVTTLGSLTIPVGKVIEKTGLIAALMVLGSTGNFQYEIHAQPLGEVRRSVQATWNDTEHQTEIDAVVEQKIQDPLCYSVADCMAVATFEGMVAQMQRRRVMIEKVAHLQDEEGDTIRVIHPYSGQTIDLYVASLKRKFKKADPGNNDGYFLDEIEGWVVS